MNRLFRGFDEPLILVTNDDGVESPGLIAAVRSVMHLGRVVVVAPTTQQTSRGRSMAGNFADVLHLTRLPGIDGCEAYHIDASPAIAASQQVDIAHHYAYGEVDWEGSTRVVRSYAERMIAALSALPPPVARSGRLRLIEPRPFPFDVLKIDAPTECPPGTPERLSRLARRHYFVFTIDAPTAESPIGAGRTRVDEEVDLIRSGDDVHTLAVKHAVALTPLSLDFTAPLDDCACPRSPPARSLRLTVRRTLTKGLARPNN